MNELERFTVVERRVSRWYLPPVAVGIYIAVAGLGLVNLPRWVCLGLPWASPVEKPGDALFIAGVLALAIDRSLKHELLADAARGLFVHMLGFDQQPAIKKRLAEITFTTKLFITYSTVMVVSITGVTVAKSW